MLCSWASRILSFRSQRWGSCHLARRANKQLHNNNNMNWKRTISTIRLNNQLLLFKILRGNIVDDYKRSSFIVFTSQSFNNLNRSSYFENSIQILRNKRRAFCHLNVEEETKSFVEECNVGERQQHSFLNRHHSVTEWFPVFKYVIIVMSSYLFNK